MNKIEIYGSCNGGNPSASIEHLKSATRQELTSLYQAGASVTGPVRFALVAEDLGSTWSPALEAAAATWPLEIDPASVSITPYEAATYRAGSSRALTEPDAEILRELRRAFFQKGNASLSGGFVPIRGAQGEHFELYVRDSISLEDAQGILQLD
jgi:hypothetical protein